MRFPRWLIPRFNLKALFVIVALVALWLGWQVYTVRHRRAVRDQLKMEGAQVRSSLESNSKLTSQQWRTFIKDTALKSSGLVLVRDADGTTGPGWLRNLLGDQDIIFISLKHLPTDADRQLVSCFPEAVVTARDGVSSPPATVSRSPLAPPRGAGSQ